MTKDKNTTPRKVTMRTDVLSELVTRHSQKIAAIGPDEEYKVLYTMGGEEFTVVDGVVQKINEDKDTENV